MVGIVGDTVGSLDTVVGHVVDPVVDTLGLVTQAVETTIDQALEPLSTVVGDAVSGAAGVAGIALSALEGLTSVSNSIGADANAQAGASVGALVAGALDSVTDIDGAHDIVASGGNIVLPELALDGLLRVDDMFTGGSYTPYNLALNAKSPVAHFQGAGNSASIAETILGDQHGDGGAQNDHHSAQLSNGIVPSVLEELHLRGLDGLG